MSDQPIDYSTFSHAQLALALQDHVSDPWRPDPLLVEASARLARIAMERSECTGMMVNNATVYFHKPKPFSAVRYMVGDDRFETEIMTVRGLRPGEVRAVDRFGEVIVIVRQPEQAQETQRS
jgi:hypothetical protein